MILKEPVVEDYIDRRLDEDLVLYRETLERAEKAEAELANEHRANNILIEQMESLARQRDRLKEEIGELATGHLKAQHRAAVENSRFREAVCLNCGKSLPPDGDCYACVNDRLMTVLKEIAFNNDIDPRAEAREALELVK